MFNNLAFFLAGVFATGLMMDRGINLPKRIGDSINWDVITDTVDDAWDNHGHD